MEFKNKSNEDEQEKMPVDKPDVTPIPKKRRKCKLNKWGMPKLSNTHKLNRRKHWIDKYKLHMGCARKDSCAVPGGYNKHPRALSFHHLPGTVKNPLTKNGGSKMNGGGMFNLYNPKVASVKVLMEEIRKCELVCSNCHMEDRYPINDRS